MANRNDTPRAGIARRDAAFAQSDRSLAATPAPAAHGTVALERRVSVLRRRTRPSTGWPTWTSSHVTSLRSITCTSGPKACPCIVVT
jgi:hypothetical protein